jgi:hypothetical protein
MDQGLDLGDDKRARERASKWCPLLTSVMCVRYRGGNTRSMSMDCVFVLAHRRLEDIARPRRVTRRSVSRSFVLRYSHVYCSECWLTPGVLDARLGRGTLGTIELFLAPVPSSRFLHVRDI